MHVFAESDTDLDLVSMGQPVRRTRLTCYRARPARAVYDRARADAQVVAAPLLSLVDGLARH